MSFTFQYWWYQFCVITNCYLFPRNVQESCHSPWRLRRRGKWVVPEKPKGGHLPPPWWRLPTCRAKFWLRPNFKVYFNKYIDSKLEYVIIIDKLSLFVDIHRLVSLMGKFSKMELLLQIPKTISHRLRPKRSVSILPIYFHCKDYRGKLYRFLTSQ